MILNNWLFYGSGGGMRTGDYNTPQGKVLNSATEMTNYKVGAGRGSRVSSIDRQVHGRVAPEDGRTRGVVGTGVN